MEITISENIGLLIFCTMIICKKVPTAQLILFLIHMLLKENRFKIF